MEKVQEGKVLKYLSKNLTLKQRRKDHKNNHQSQLCKSKNEKESLWMVFAYSKSETSGAIISNLEPRTDLLLFSPSTVSPVAVTSLYEMVCDVHISLVSAFY